MTLEELDEVLERPSGPPPEIDWEEETMQCLDLVQEAKPILEACLNHNAKHNFLPKKQKQEVKKLLKDIEWYLSGWNFS